MSPRIKVIIGGLLACGVAGAVTWFATQRHPREDHYTPRPHGSVTFNKDVAPIVRERCVTCHRPGQSGPFNLISFEDVSRRAKQVAEVTASRYMPPWLPEPGYGEFAGERRLITDELGLIQQWIKEGSTEGNPNGSLAPLASDEWQLGKPDLVVTLPEPYVLDPAGKDVYRNV